MLESLQGRWGSSNILDVWWKRLCMLVVELLFGRWEPCPKPVGQVSVDGSPMPLGSTAAHDLMKEEARWNSLGITTNLYKMIGVNT